MDWDTVELINDKDADILELKEENERLQAQLDREIHINRKMKKALETYAGPEILYYYIATKEKFYELAQQTLKQIEEME